MKTSIVIFATAALLAVTFNACNNNNQANSTTSHPKKGKYTCTMHPAISSDKPGVCPKCGMELVERDTTGDK
jgi:Cu+-exporting ATPase